MKNIFILFLAIASLTSCRSSESDALIVRYRLIGQIVAYQEDGGVEYSDFIADSGVAVVEDDQLILEFPKSNKTIRVLIQLEQKSITFSLHDIETEGTLNSWTRLKKRDSSAFGPDTECEVWVGTTEPEKETQQANRIDG